MLPARPGLTGFLFPSSFTSSCLFFFHKTAASASAAVVAAAAAALRSSARRLQTQTLLPCPIALSHSSRATHAALVAVPGGARVLQVPASTSRHQPSPPQRPRLLARPGSELDQVPPLPLAAWAPFRDQRLGATKYLTTSHPLSLGLVARPGRARFPPSISLLFSRPTISNAILHSSPIPTLTAVILYLPPAFRPLPVHKIDRFPRANSP